MCCTAVIGFPTVDGVDSSCVPCISPGPPETSTYGLPLQSPCSSRLQFRVRLSSLRSDPKGLPPVYSVSKITCPHCALTYPSGEFKKVDSDAVIFEPDEQSVDTPKAPTSWTSRIRRLARPFDESSNSNDEVKRRIRSLAAGLQLRCPNPNCNADLPRALGDRPTVFVAMVGLSGSAKTSFLAASVVQWRDGDVMPAQGISYSPKSHSKDLEDAIERMFIDLVPPGTTYLLQPGERHDPVVVVARTDHRTEVNIVFIDVSGEALVDEQQMASEAEFLAIAQHVFILVTPAILRGLPKRPIIQAILADEEVTDDLDYGFGNNQSVNQTLRMIDGLSAIRGANGHPIGGPNITVSVVFTKGDLLRGLYQSEEFRTQAAGIVPPQDWVTQQPQTSDVITDERIMEMSERIQRLLSQLHPNLASSLKNGFPEARYFIVSAAGTIAKRTTDPEKGMTVAKFSAVVPFRCTDPFLDMLRRRPELRLSLSTRGL